MQTVMLDPAKVRVQEGFNPRTQMEVAELERLRDSIEAHGLINPPTVRREGDDFVLVAGHRRHAALQLLEQTEVAYRVVDPSQDDLVIAAVENMQRVDLTPVEEALAVKRMLDTGRSQKGVQEELKISSLRFKRAMQILSLGPKARAHVGKGSIQGKALEQLSRLAASAPEASEALADAVAAQPQAFATDPVGVLRAHATPMAKEGVWVSGIGYDFSKSKVIPQETAQLAAASGPVKFGKAMYERVAPLKCVIFGNEDSFAFVGTEVVVEYAVEAIKDQALRRAQEKQRYEASQKRGSQVVRDAEGNEITDPEAAKAARAARREAFVKRGVEATQENARFVQKLFEKVGPGTVELDLPTAKMLAAAVIGKEGGKIGGSGARYVLPGFAREETVKDKVKTVYPNASETRKLVSEYVMAGATGEDVLARLLHVLLCQKHVSEDVVPESSRVGWADLPGQSLDHHDGSTAYDSVYQAGIKHLTKKYKLG